MKYQQYLSIEICQGCNLAAQHGKCPSAHEERYGYLQKPRKLDPDIIVSCVERMYHEFGFRGMVAWHYYNEPLLAKDLMFCVMNRIKAKVAEARFVLWTNGTLLPKNLSEYRLFSSIWVTDYRIPNKPIPLRQLNELNGEDGGPTVYINSWPLDDRLLSLGTVKRDHPCGRPYVEFIIDFWGNVHICCVDWRGLASPGNIFLDPLEDIVGKFRLLRRKIYGHGRQMSAEAPDVCRRCTHPMRNPGIPRFVPEVAWEAIREGKSA